MNSKNFFKEIIEKSGTGYAYHKMIFDKRQKPVDYVFLDANKAFGQMTGLDVDNIQGKTVRQLLPDIIKDEFDWISYYGNMTLEGGCRQFQKYSKSLEKYYKVIAYCPQKYHFVTIVSEAVDIERELMESRKIYKKTMKELSLILDSISEGIIGIDINGDCIYCNKSALNILGYQSSEEIKGKNAHQLIHYNDIKGNKLSKDNCVLCKEFKQGKSSIMSNVVYWKKDGSYFYADVKCNPQYSNGNLIGGVISFTDKTQLMLTQKNLKESERSKSALLSHLPGMAFRCRNDRDWTMEYVSQGCYELTGYPCESLLYNRDLSYNDLIEPAKRQYLWDKWQKVLEKRLEFREEYQIMTAEGKSKWVLERAQGVYDDKGRVKAIEGIIIDIDELKEKENEIKYLNEHDHMTGVYNRRYFERLKEKLDSGKYMPLSVIMGDINGVKLINDAIGHDKGDKVIKTTADLLKTVLRDDDILARVGGDEFLYLLPNTDADQAAKIVDKLKKAFDEYNKRVNKDDFYLSISLGCATKNDNENIDSVVKKAEDNMYQSKLFEHKSSHSQLVSSIKSTMFERSQETEEHAARLSKLAIRMGKQLGFSMGKLQELNLLATLHDIGKIAIDDRILKKPSKLTEEEWKIMQTHSQIGYRIAMSSPEFASVADYILYHHERWDGKGYPAGLKEEEIPLPSRIICLVDAYDAMTNDRPYCKAKTKAEAIEEIKINSGKQFDPDLVEVFLKKVLKI